MLSTTFKLLPSNTYAVFLGYLTIVLAASPDVNTYPNCLEFSKGVVFNDTKLYGTWRLMHKTHKNPSSSTPSVLNCQDITIRAVDKDDAPLLRKIQDRNKNLDWDSIVIRGDNTCMDGEDGYGYPRVDYIKWTVLFEKLDRPGSYNSYIVLGNVGFSKRKHHRDFEQMQMQVINDEYLIVLNCIDNTLFFYSKRDLNKQDMDSKLEKLIDYMSTYNSSKTFKYVIYISAPTDDNEN